MNEETPKVSGYELRAFGVVQELNRRLLHPRGLALFVRMEEDGAVPDALDRVGWILPALLLVACCAGLVLTCPEDPAPVVPMEVRR